MVITIPEYESIVYRVDYGCDTVHYSTKVSEALCVLLIIAEGFCYLGLPQAFACFKRTCPRLKLTAEYSLYPHRTFKPINYQ